MNTAIFLVPGNLSPRIRSYAIYLILSFSKALWASLTGLHDTHSAAAALLADHSEIESELGHVWLFPQQAFVLIHKK